MDHATHDNDIGGLVVDQLAVDDALAAAGPRSAVLGGVVRNDAVHGIMCVAQGLPAAEQTARGEARGDACLRTAGPAGRERGWPHPGSR